MIKASAKAQGSEMSVFGYSTAISKAKKQNKMSSFCFHLAYLIFEFCLSQPEA